jgi:hypothetical protein
MGKYSWLLLGLVIVLILLYIRSSYISYNILWTCTAYFDYNKGERWDAFCTAMDSIVKHHTPETLAHIDKWVLLNEYDPEPKRDYARLIREKYPWITYEQKRPGNEGISNSVNYLLKTYVPNSRLWIHWEETWVVRAPFLDRAIRIMNTHPYITQLTFVYKNGRTEWSDVDDGRLTCRGDFCTVKPHPDSAWYDSWNGSVEGMTTEVQQKWATTWPLYQLMPSINRSSFYPQLPLFHTQYKYAEWLYAREWLRAGGIKAFFWNAPVWRPTDATHVSTHD